MMTHTCVASHNLEEEESTPFIPPCRRSGRIYFVILAAIRAGVQPNSRHDENLSGKRHCNVAAMTL
jgi:hypothetical protein